MELKKIDFSTNSFEALGITYYIKPSLSVERWKWFEKYQNHFAFGKTFQVIYDLLKNSVDFANKGKGLEAWNIIFNLMQTVGKNLDDKSHPALLICALFIATEDEDLTKWDEQQAEKKIKAWNDEGIDINSFFQLASNFVTGFLTALDEISQDTLGITSLT
jgi:hypothetical protein